MIYNINTLLSRLKEIKKDGYNYVDIYEFDADADADGETLPGGLAFEAVDGYGVCSVDYDHVEEVPPSEVSAFARRGVRAPA